MRTCCACGETKSFDDFFYKDRTGRYSRRCRECGTDQSEMCAASTHRKMRSLLSFRIGNAKASRKTRRKKGLSYPEVYLTVEELLDLLEKQGGKCALSGLTITHSLDDPYTNASIDRINCDGDYEIGNVRIVCNAVNLMRRRMSDEDFIGFCRSIVENNVRTD